METGAAFLRRATVVVMPVRDNSVVNVAIDNTPCFMAVLLLANKLLIAVIGADAPAVFSEVTPGFDRKAELWLNRRGGVLAFLQVHQKVGQIHANDVVTNWVVAAPMPEVDQSD